MNSISPRVLDRDLFHLNQNCFLPPKILYEEVAPPRAGEHGGRRGINLLPNNLFCRVVFCHTICSISTFGWQQCDILCCAEKQCDCSCQRGSNLSHHFSAQQSTVVVIVSRSYTDESNNLLKSHSISTFSFRGRRVSPLKFSFSSPSSASVALK